MVVEAEELGVRVFLGHEDVGGSEAAAYVGHFGSGGELGDVAGAEESLGAVEEVVVVPVPADALAGPEGLFDFVRVVKAG
jgi:hypothetical protein